MEDLDVNMAIWGIFLNTTLQAAVHLGQHYEANLRDVKNHLWNGVGQLFRETGKLISDQKEITGVSTINFKDATWMSTSMFRQKAYQITNAKTYVFSDSVLCVGKMGDDPIATWKSKIKWYLGNNHFKDMNRIDGMPTEFEWKIISGITTLGLLEKIQSLMRDLQCELELIMSIFNDIVWDANRNKEQCAHNSPTVAKICSKIPSRSLVMLGPGSEKKWYGTYTDKPDGSWDEIAENMMTNFSDFGHPIFRASGAFERGQWRSKGDGKKSIHFGGSDENIELLLRTVISANQLSVHGHWQIYETNYPKTYGLWRNLKHLIIWDTMKIPTSSSITKTQTNAQQRGNLVQEYERKFEQLSEDQKVSKRSWFETSQDWTILLYS